MNTNVIELATANKEFSVSVHLDYSPTTVMEIAGEKLQTVTMSVAIHRPGRRLGPDVNIHTNVIYVANGDAVHPCVDFVNTALAEYAKFYNELSWQARATMTRREHCTNLHRIILRQIAVQADKVADFFELKSAGILPSDKPKAQEQENLLA